MRLQDVKKILLDAGVHLYGGKIIRGIQVSERDSHVLITYRSSYPGSANSDLRQSHERGEIWWCANILKDLFQVSVWTGVEGPPHQPFLLIHPNDQPTGEILKIDKLSAAMEGK
jgi:hypothetical protein